MKTLANNQHLWAENQGVIFISFSPKAFAPTYLCHMLMSA